MKVNQRELAEIFGKSQGAIKLWQKDGMPYVMKGKRGKENSYDTIKVYDWLLAKHIDENPREIDIERTRLIRAQAENKEIENSRLRGELLPITIITMTWQSIISAARSHILSLSSKIRGKYPSINDEIYKYIQDQCRIILEDMASDGIPADFNKRLAKHLKDLDAATSTDIK